MIFIRTPAEIEALAAQAPDNGSVYLLPAFAGLSVPRWDADARRAIVGTHAWGHQRPPWFGRPWKASLTR